MSLFRLTLLMGIIISGCSSSEPKSKPAGQNQPEYPNLISVNSPENQQATPSKVYIDSVSIINHLGNKALLISGNMANGCTYLREASHSTAGDSLSITLKAWKPADKICSQALVPFSFIYDEMPAQTLEKSRSAMVNKKKFKFKQ